MPTINLLLPQNCIDVYKGHASLLVIPLEYCHVTTVATVAQTKNGPDFRDSRKIKNLNDYKGPDPLHSISKLGRVLSQASCSKITISNCLRVLLFMQLHAV